MNQTKRTSPWSWIPTLYFAEALPYVAVMTISVIMYKRMGISNTDIALYTSWLYLPWVIKPFWSPFVDLLKTKRWWVVTMQFLIGAGLAGIAFTLPMEYAFQLSLAIFWPVAFSSATHDIAADGFYMLALDPHEQAFYVGIRSTFYRIATIAGQGLLVMLAGVLEVATGKIPLAWSITFLIMAGLFIGFCLYHKYILPVPASDKAAVTVTASTIFKEFFATFVSFFKKKQALVAILFMLLYRFPGSPVGEAGDTVPDRFAGSGRTGLDHVGIRFGIWHDRHYRSDAGWYNRWYCGFTRRSEEMALADGVGYYIA